MAVIGLLGGGRLALIQAPLSAWLLLLYLATLSAIAFSLWTLLLRFHPLTRIGIFQASIPLIGSLGAWLILGEAFWTWSNLIAVVLVTGSIVLVKLATGKN